MATATIPLEVDSATAETYSAASLADRRKLQLLLGVRLRELMSDPARPLDVVLDDIGRHTDANGVTPERSASSTLAELLDGITPENLHAEWAAGPPIGVETL